MQTTKIGNLGEQLAAEELSRQGYKIIERNWKNKLAEIDIIALKNEVTYFIEVKYRSTTNQGEGFDYITNNKLQHMKRAAELWVSVHNWLGEMELLAVAVSGDGNVEITEVI